MSILVSIYGFLFYDVLELLLGLLGLMMASCAASGPQKPSKTEGFSEVFENAACLLFEALDDALGLVLPAFWADLASKWVPQWTPKWSQNGSKKKSEKGFQ